MRTVKDYLELLKNLLPRGDLWRVEKNSLFEKLLLAKAEELARLDAENYRFIQEINPLFSMEMLEDWERVLGLPGECISSQNSMEKRRALVLYKILRGKNFNKEYIKNLCAIFGYEDVTIESFKPFLAGQSSAGDRINSVDAKWRYTFRIHLGETKIDYFKAGQSCAGSRLATWGDSIIECLLNKQKPAHIKLIFSYNTEVMYA